MIRIRVLRRYYWAVVSRDGVVIEDTIRRSKRKAMEDFVRSRRSDVDLTDRTWRRWRRLGVTTCRVYVDPIEPGEVLRR